MSRVIRWGIVGAGFIATHFARDLALLPDATITAVGSRRPGGATEFANEFNIPVRYDSYTQLVQDPDVDVVYIATPHSGHYDAAMLAITAGKAVLVEKPLTINAAQSEALIAAARAAGVFFMEAMWTRFLPHMVKIRSLIEEGALGDLVSITAEQGLWFDPEQPSHRLYDHKLGGGALLDLGVYPISLILSLLGEPTTITSASDMTDTGVDAQTTVIFQDGKGRHGIATTTLSATTANRAVISGTEARIEVGEMWMMPSDFTLIKRSGERIRFPNEDTGHGLRHEAAEVGRCIREGLLESPSMPHEFSILVMRALDTIRSQIGLRYEADDARFAS